MDKRVIVGTAGAAGIGSVAYLGRSRTSKDTTGGIPVDAGALTPQRELLAQAEEGYVEVNDRKHPIGSYAAYQAWYGVCCGYSKLTSNAARVFRKSLTRDQILILDSSFRSTGKFNLSGFQSEQRDICVLMTNCFIHFAQSLIVLADLAVAAGYRAPVRPAEWQHKGIDLSNLVYQGVTNPLVTREGGGRWKGVVRKITSSLGWKYIGWEIIRAFSDAYAVDLDPASARIAVEYMTRDAAELEKSPGSVQTMGALPVLIPVVAKGVALIVVAIGVAYAIDSVIEAASLFLGINLGFARSQVEAYEKAIDCALNPDLTPEQRESCRTTAGELASEIRSYKPGWSTWITLGIIGTIGLGTIFLLQRN